MKLSPESLVPIEVLRGMLDAASDSPPGAFVEVGVYKGGTAWHLAKLAEIQGRELYLYDTFTGQPWADSDDAHPVGDFSDTSFETVVDALKEFPSSHVIKGVFPASAVLMPKIAFAHLDCDQYRSIKLACEYLLPHMVPGGRFWFDDAPQLKGALRAVRECFGDLAIENSVSRMEVRL